MMKRFIVRALCFILPVLAGLTLGEYFLRQVPNDYSFKKEWLDHNSSQVEVLVLGSSHTYYGVNPVYFSKKSFNAAYVSQSIPYDYFIFTKYVNQMKNLSYVILPISYFSLWGSLENDGEAYRLKNYSIYYDCKYHKWYELSNQLELFDKKNLAKAIYKAALGTSHLYSNEKGFGTLYKKEKRLPGWEKNGKEEVRRHSRSPLSDYRELEKENLWYLNQIIEICRNRNVEVILLTTPTWPTYYECLNKEQYSRMVHICDSLSEKYGNVVYWNLLKDKRFISDDFYDVNHLSNYGAKKLTLILDEKIKELEWSKMSE